MSHTDDRRSVVLPITNELGSEGGSYGDPTMQVETFEEPPKDARAPGVGGPASAANYAVRREEMVSPPGEPAPTRSGMARYPTEPPPSEDARPAGRLWSPGLVGAAAGLAIGLIAARRR